MIPLSLFLHHSKHSTPFGKTAIIVFTTLSFLFALGGCSTTKYNVAGKSFTSREEAEIAHSELMKHTLSMVSSVNSPAIGKVLIAMPTIEKLEKTGIRMTSGKQSSLSDDVIQYLCNIAMRENETFAEAVKKRNLFNIVETIKSNNPQDESFTGYDFLIYLYNPDPSIYSWYVKGHDRPDPQIIVSEGSDFLQKTLSKLNNIEKLVGNKH